MKSFIHSLVMLFAAVTVLIICSCAQCGSCSHNAGSDDPILLVGDDIAIAQTAYGKVRGFILRDIYQFRGIPYGASTAGANRFMPPQEPEPWDYVRPAMNFGESAPQVVFYDRRPESVSGFVDHWNYDLIGEDCLRLNVWTPGLDQEKRPVLVWLHGGGFSSGNGIEQDGYDGENLSRYGDIVCVSINHRLNAFGFSDFAAVGGEKYLHSGNVGMLDIIAALKWVNKNIDQFGGDPGNVTVMGQSGGGFKVSLIAAMPSAKGLVHKGVPLSGNSIRANDKAYSEALGAFILEKAGLKPSEIDKLQEMPWEEYYALANAALKEFKMEGHTMIGGFSPVGDGIDIPAGTFYDPQDTSIPDIPMLYCTTLQEWNPNRDNPDLENITFDQVIQFMGGQYGEKAKAVVEAYSKAFPDFRPIEILAMLGWNRTSVVESADTKLGQTSPVYMALFTWQPPMFNGRMRAFHCLDISFWFHNTDIMYTHTGGGKRPRVLSDKMSDALIAFMRTGNPNCKSLPEWPEYNSEEGPLMILDDVCHVENDPDREARKAITD